jgi:hypothetical protein
MPEYKEISDEARDFKTPDKKKKGVMGFIKKAASYALTGAALTGMVGAGQRTETLNKGPEQKMNVGLNKERIKLELKEISSLIDASLSDESPELKKQKTKLLDTINLAEFNLSLGLDNAFKNLIGEAITRALAMNMENIAERLAAFIN